MPNAKDFTLETNFIKVFIVGDPGTGKSIFASSFPEPIYLFNFGDTVLSYRGKDVDYEDYGSTAGGWVKFEKDLKRLKDLIKAGEFKYKTVVVDDTTSWTDLAMGRAMQLDPKRSPTGGPMWNVHYGMVKNLIEGNLRQMLEFPCNLVVIGHLNKNLDADTGAVISIEPMLTGQLSTKVPSYFDEVYYSIRETIKGQTEFKLLTVGKGHLNARSRLSGKEHFLPDKIDNNYDTLMECMKGVK